MSDENTLKKTYTKAIQPLINPSGGWKETCVLGFITLVQMLLGALLVGGLIIQKNTETNLIIVGAIISVLLMFLLLLRRLSISSIKLNSEEKWHYNILIIIFILLGTIFIGGLFGTSTKPEMVGAFLLVLLLFSLTFTFFIYYFREIVEHPIVKALRSYTEETITQLSNRTTEIKETDNSLHNLANNILAQSHKNLADAKKLMLPKALTDQKILILGEDEKGKEMMDVVFEDYLTPEQSHTLTIDFMGTAYGAFSFDNSLDYGFLGGLKKHIRNCKRNELDYPFSNIRFVCGKSPLYSLSAKYLCLSILDEIKQKNRKIDNIQITYPHEDIIPATLIISSLMVGERALISPSIGSKDKEFLAKHYPIGIMIKNIDGAGAQNTITRLKEPFRAYMKDTNKTETWEISDGNIAVTNLQKIVFDSSFKYPEDENDCVPGIKSAMIYKNDNSELVTQSFTIKPDEIKHMLSYIEACIKSLEQNSIHN